MSLLSLCKLAPFTKCSSSWMADWSVKSSFISRQWNSWVCSTSSVMRSLPSTSCLNNSEMNQMRNMSERATSNMTMDSHHSSNAVMPSILLWIRTKNPICIYSLDIWFSGIGHLPKSEWRGVKQFDCKQRVCVGERELYVTVQHVPSTEGIRGSFVEYRSVIPRRRRPSCPASNIWTHTGGTNSRTLRSLRQVIRAHKNENADPESGSNGINFGCWNHYIPSQSVITPTLVVCPNMNLVAQWIFGDM